MSVPDKCFRIKEFHKIDWVDNDLIEASFATVDRMINLMGDIEFKVYLDAPLNDVVTLMMAHHEKYGNIDTRIDKSKLDLVFQAYRECLDTSLSFHSLIAQGYQEQYTPLYEAHRLLRRNGLFFPTYPSCPCSLIDLQIAADELVNQAGNLTYKDVYTTKPGQVSRRAGNAMRMALSTGILYRFESNSCCCHGTCYPTGSGGCMGGETCSCTMMECCCHPPDEDC